MAKRGRKPKGRGIEGWGGNREGSGAPRKWDGQETVNMTVRLPKGVIDQIDAVANSSKLNRAEALVKMIDPALFAAANPVVAKVAQGPTREPVIAMEI